MWGCEEAEHTMFLDGNSIQYMMWLNNTGDSFVALNAILTHSLQ
jgi:hypothetical protein